MIRINTSNPHGNEMAVANIYCSGSSRKEGIPNEVLEIAPGRARALAACGRPLPDTANAMCCRSQGHCRRRSNQGTGGPLAAVIRDGLSVRRGLIA